VDADVAKPGLSKTLNIREKPGLIEHLVDGRTDLSEMLLRTDIPKLTVLPAGQKHKRSTELLASGNMKKLLDELSSRYPDRIVLFDSPPLLETSEASVLASLMGQVLVVVESETTSQVIVKEALSQFADMDNVYLILNKCKENMFSGRHGYGYSYGYGYGSYGES
jgi:Mrp family chromosome partitioning ATPase